MLALVFLASTAPYSARAVALRQRQAPAAPASAGSKRIGAVIDTLQDLLTTINNQEKGEGDNYKCAVAWCDKEIGSKKTEIEAAEVKLDDLNIEVRQHKAKITMLQYVLDKNAKDMSEFSDGIDQAKGIRDEEQSKYNEDKSLNMQSMGQVTQAINIVQRVHQVGGFLQNGVVQKMQLNEPGESNFVLGVMKSLKQGLERNQKKSDEDEAKKQALHDKLITTKSSQLSAAQEETRTKSLTVSETKTKLTQASNDIETLEEVTKNNKNYLYDTETSCGDKKKEWQVRGEDRAKEKAAITEAISFLKITFTEKASEETRVALLQMQRQRVRDRADGLIDPDDDGDEAIPPSFLQVSNMGAASALVGTADAELAMLSAGIDSNAKKDIFDKVKGVVNNLIGILQTQQTEETSKRNWCQGETKKKEGEKADTQDELKSLNAVIARKTAEVDTMAQEVTEINAAIAQSKQRDAEAEKLRKEAKAIFESGSKDRTLAIKVLRQAKQVLAKFYESQDKTGLLQAGHRQIPGQMPDTFSGSSRRTGEGNVVLAMLDKITDDMSREAKDAATEEKEQQSAFETEVKESRKEFDQRMEEITLRVTRKAKVLVQLDSHKESQSQSTDTMTTVTQQLAGLAADCDEIVKNHDDREKARTFEVAQLRDVIDILSGSQVAARTGLVQSQVGVVGDREFSALQDMTSAISGLETRARSLVSN